MSRRRRWLTPLRARFIGWRLVLMLVALTAAYGGIKLRFALYANSELFRFRGDINNGWHQGTEVYRQADVLRYARLHGGATTQPSLRNSIEWIDYFTALRDRYETLLETANNDNYGLDYPPARLLIMSSWVWENCRHGPRSLPKPSDVNLASPLLRLNTAFEALAALAAFLIVRRVLVSDQSQHAATCGMAAALLVWFNPAALINAHVWPQWDVWVLPFYLWGCWFALRGNWLICGALLALGAMCKGQMLLIAPALVLWPLLRGQWWAAIDLVLGFFVAAASFAAPWLLNNHDAVRLFEQLLGPTLLACCLMRRPGHGPANKISTASPPSPYMPGEGLGTGHDVNAPHRSAQTLNPALSPSSTRLSSSELGRGSLKSISQAMPSLRWILFALTATILFCGFERGSMAWYLVGFAYGARHFQAVLHIGMIPNLAAVLANQYGWGSRDTIARVFSRPITTRELLMTLHLLGTAVCAVALALQSRRGDRRILLALALPWLSAACLLPQMHERYLLWAGVLTAMAAGVSLGTTLLHIGIAVWASVPMATALLEQVPRDKATPAMLAVVDHWHTILHNSFPSGAWSVLTLLLIWIYLAITPSRSVKPGR